MWRCKNELIKICNGWLITNNNNIQQLNIIQDKILNIINNHSVNYISDVLKDVNNRINLLMEQQKYELFLKLY